jgi:hypothetical protein
MIKLKVRVFFIIFQLQCFYYVKILKKKPIRPILFMMKYAPDVVVKRFMHKVFYIDEGVHKLLDEYLRNKQEWKQGR